MRINILLLAVGLGFCGCMGNQGEFKTDAELMGLHGNVRSLSIDLIDSLDGEYTDYELLGVSAENYRIEADGRCREYEKLLALRKRFGITVETDTSGLERVVLSGDSVVGRIYYFDGDFDEQGNWIRRSIDVYGEDTIRYIELRYIEYAEDEW